jgi:hypothetical protein
MMIAFKGTTSSSRKLRRRNGATSSFKVRSMRLFDKWLKSNIVNYVFGVRGCSDITLSIFSDFSKEIFLNTTNGGGAAPPLVCVWGSGHFCTLTSKH